MQASPSRFTWNGLAAGGGLLLPLDRSVWPLPENSLVVDDRRFTPKRELHVTLFTRAQARALRDRDADLAEVRSLAQHLDWQWSFRDELWLLRRERDGSVAESIVVMIDMPAQARFRRRLHQAFGLDLGEPVPHVTLFTRGDPGGISVADAVVFQSLRVAHIAPAQLQSTPRAHP